MMFIVTSNIHAPIASRYVPNFSHYNHFIVHARRTFTSVALYLRLLLFGKA